MDLLRSGSKDRWKNNKKISRALKSFNQVWKIPLSLEVSSTSWLQKLFLSNFGNLKIKFQPFPHQQLPPAFFSYSPSTTYSWSVNNSDPISLPHIHISSSSQFHILNHLQNSRDWKGCKHDERESERKFQWGNSAKFNSRTTKSISFHFLFLSCLTPYNNFINHFHHLQSQAERWWQRPLNQKGFSHSSSLPLQFFIIVKKHEKVENDRFFFADLKIKFCKIFTLHWSIFSSYRWHLHVVKRIICNWCNIKDAHHKRV